MCCQNGNVKLSNLFAEVTSAVIRHQLILTQFSFVGLYNSRLFKGADKTRRRIPIDHLCNSLTEDSFCIFTPVLLRAVLGIGSLNCSVLLASDSNDKFLGVRSESLFNWPAQIAIQSVSHVVEIDRVHVLVRWFTLIWVKVNFVEFIFQLVQIYVVVRLLRRLLCTLCPLLIILLLSKLIDLLFNCLLLQLLLFQNISILATSQFVFSLSLFIFIHDNELI